MFEDIRPYRDHEVAQVLQKLLNEAELTSAIANFSLPKFYRLMPRLCSALVKTYLSSRVKKLHNIEQIQTEVAKYLNKLIKQSTQGVSHSGLDQLDLSKPTLFISNHRDIVLDVAFINHALHKSGTDTVEAAVGDNLLHKEWVADLMRINKSFIVKRNEASKRAMLTASKQLSAYIHHSLTDNQQHIWIAQKEGRAKDGIDKTNAALISMLLLNKAKNVAIADYLSEINIVPVSIAYEYDPCDNDKAVELAQTHSTGDYQKAEDEDFNSIIQGLIGEKGKVHIAFGSSIQGDFQDSKEIAAAIDQQIIANYKLYQSNQSANQALEANDNNLLDSQLKQRITHLTTEQQHWLLTMYANPVKAKQALS